MSVDDDEVAAPEASNVNRVSMMRAGEPSEGSHVVVSSIRSLQIDLLCSIKAVLLATWKQL
jgi:hypothetical protein